MVREGWGIRFATHTEHWCNAVQDADGSGKFLFGKESPASPLPPFALTPPMPAHVAAADEYFGERAVLACCPNRVQVLVKSALNTVDSNI